MQAQKAFLPGADSKACRVWSQQSEKPEEASVLYLFLKEFSERLGCV